MGPRGRPRGSKNKPKSPIIDNTLNSIVIEIPPDNDVIQFLIDFACSHQVNLIVTSGSGIVSGIHIRHPDPLYGSTLIYPGLYRMISLSGTYMNFHFPHSFSIANNLPCVKNFTIRVFGSQGVVYNGIVAGKVMAASNVVVNALISKNFEYHKARSIDGNILIEEDEEHSSSFSDQHSSDSNIIVVNTNNA
ncbi:AT-hook motif nuclear-localized protein 28-like [Lotus japonicus]|uniref:AT-hook motif nuclear-localized protein 28-like n=1 Tax=Lotus japonicus TaxID=34305 RepID=UPI0025872F83|nr:AT-hook motif nuclear-localized protein 28-like [Lotus japonicus]